MRQIPSLSGPFCNVIRKHLRSDTVKPNFKIP